VLGLVTIQQCIKFEISTFTHYEDMKVTKNAEIGVVWCQKTRVTGLLCGIICVILHLAVFIQYRSVTDTHTHRQTDRHTTMAYTALSIASRGNVSTVQALI